MPRVSGKPNLTAGIYRHIYTAMMTEMDTTALKEFLDENPKLIEILRLAIEVEEASPDQKGKWGWEWHDVRGHPSRLMKLVLAGVVKVTHKSNRSTMYLLIDRPMVKRTLCSNV